MSESIVQTPAAPAREELAITGMTCANCASTIERALQRKVPGVRTATVNLATERASVEYDPALAAHADLVAAIERAGYGVVEPQAGIEMAQAVSVASSAATVSQVSPSPAEASSSPGSTSDDSPPAGTVGTTSTLSSTIRPSSSRRATNRR